MYPRWHIILGAVLVALVWIFIPNIPIFYLSLIFLSSFLIDFDHFAVSVIKTKKLGLKDSFNYHKQKHLEEIKEIKIGLRKKGDFHLFHTIEFQTIIGVLGFFWAGFFYIFIGLVFHSLLDIFALLFTGFFHRREFFLFNWMKNKDA